MDYTTTSSSSFVMVELITLLVPNVQCLQFDSDLFDFSKYEFLSLITLPSEFCFLNRKMLETSRLCLSMIVLLRDFAMHQTSKALAYINWDYNGTSSSMRMHTSDLINCVHFNKHIISFESSRRWSSARWLLSLTWSGPSSVSASYRWACRWRTQRRKGQWWPSGSLCWRWEFSCEFWLVSLCSLLLVYLYSLWETLAGLFGDMTARL